MSETDLPASLQALPLYSRTCWGMLHRQFLRDALPQPVPQGCCTASSWGMHCHRDSCKARSLLAGKPSDLDSTGLVVTPPWGQSFPGESPQWHLWGQQWPQLRLLFQVFQRNWQLKSPFVHCWVSASCSLESFNSPGLWTKKEKLERGWGQKMVLTHKCASCHGHSLMNKQEVLKQKFTVVSSNSSFW